jgi:hypothetical protein
MTQIATQFHRFIDDSACRALMVWSFGLTALGAGILYIDWSLALAA